VAGLAACGSSNNTAPDMAGTNPDMGASCSMNPMTNDELLNGCTTAAIDHVDITPFYPTLAPNGQLPALP
jgi:hypothetical protein